MKRYTVKYKPNPVVVGNSVKRDANLKEKPDFGSTGCLILIVSIVFLMLFFGHGLLLVKFNALDYSTPGVVVSLVITTVLYVTAIIIAFRVNFNEV